MKKAVVYYSLYGSTKQVAACIAKKYEADIFELEEVKARQQGSNAFMRAGFEACFGIRTRLKKDYAKMLEDCDCIYIGTPIWAGKITPAVKSFASGINAKGKSFVVFTLQAGDITQNPCKAAEKLAAKLMAKGAQKATAVSLKGAGINETISEKTASKMVEESM